VELVGRGYWRQSRRILAREQMDLGAIEKGNPKTKVSDCPFVEISVRLSFDPSKDSLNRTILCSLPSRISLVNSFSHTYNF
jgi:hypothetical protein